MTISAEKLEKDTSTAPNSSAQLAYTQITYGGYLPMIEIPIWEKYTLTIREAAEYFHIGEKKMRQIVDENYNANFILMVGNRAMIKRKLFEQYIDVATTV